MAKKVRTPPPPRRPVQAPQRRETKRQRPAADRSRLVWLVALLALVAAAAIGSALYFALRGSGGTPTAKNYNTLPGIRRTKPPWPVDISHLDENLASLGLDTTESHFGLAFHIHAHLDIFVNGKKVPVPALIGINPSFLAELHTHLPNGVVHIESPHKGKHLTLGQLFGEWAVFLNSRCIGSECGLTWYVNGKRQTGNPAGLELKAHQEIALVVGKPPKTIPSTYAFTAGE